MQDISDSTVQPIDGEPISIDGRQAIGIAGIVFYWTWFFTIMFSGTFLLPLPAELHIEPLFREGCFLAMIVGFTMLLFVGKRVHCKKGFAAVLVGAVVCSPWVVLAYATATPEIQLPLVALVWVLFGFSASMLFYSASLFVKTLRPRSAVLALGIAVTVAAALYFLVLYMSYPAIWVAVAALPLASAACLWFAGFHASLDAERERLSPPQPLRHLVSSLRVQPAQPFYGIIFSLVVGIGISLSVIETRSFPLGTALAFCLAGPVTFAIALLPRKSDVGNIQWFLLPVAAAGLLFITLDIQQIALICCAVLAFCYSFFDLLHTLSLTELMREQDESIPYIFASGKFWFYLGTAIGWGMNVALLAVGYYTLTFNVIVLCICVFVIFVIAFLGRPSIRNREEPLDPLPAEDSGKRWDDVCMEIAEEAGLSPRQVEVFLLLSKGRNAPYIQEELVVSYHTVKAHMYRIYQKLDVHSHQELIDLVESRCK